ncbi:cyclic-di-AMP-binding protein CbpB [Liquorilactobacillus mali]|uniref:CBS domain-containing protein n=1 Tax=Liquorilactobacillus mali KCTC 3596 = DSM 20444 TaxID=1046596 RepID=J0L7N6_9LACO|nr:cyclic-di-AMP-binding protein CbpB [Liquorilactobacillus mali]EJF01433.1 CBS domain-containing protein [Liquorilactobacillus mali KCTC 3596 = DSM 20444]KRN10108.1 CBS domain-containing protein [Liquorilactobacillus mali KCTC 3596 = DSM 20444]MDC7953847.1 CBS domain-containing protein [Liquorilactobacillus mali]QFQ75192.1 CBS domain-containing protein [Liquorilactobacillus mali]
MITKQMEQMLISKQDGFLIPAEIVANVQEDNHLDHAFLVLTKVKYSSIPVLDKEQHFKGILTLPMLTETMLGLNGIDPTRLSKKKVSEVMQKDFPTIKLPYDVEEILHLLINHPFLIVINDDGVFTGIVTRREVLKAVNYMTHDFDKYYAIREKESSTIQD